MYISKELLRILVCPVTKQRLIYLPETQELISPEASLSFPIEGGIPILLASDSRPVSPERLRKILEQEKKDSLVTKTA